MQTAHPTLAQRQKLASVPEVECLNCHAHDEIARFGRLYSDREGLTIVHCTCPKCSSGFRRIIV